MSEEQLIPRGTSDFTKDGYGYSFRYKLLSSQPTGLLNGWIRMITAQSKMSTACRRFNLSACRPMVVQHSKDNGARYSDMLVRINV